MNELFITPWEGALSKQEPQLLIVLKEPNSGKGKLDCFWLKTILAKDPKDLKGAEIKYFHVLGTFAKKILDEKTKLDALKKCIFINLYPYNGKATVEGGGYSKMMSNNIWSNLFEIPAVPVYLPSEEEGLHIETILENRLQIIEAAWKKGIPLLAHKEIADKLKMQFDLTESAFYPNESGYHCHSDKSGEKLLYCLYPHPSIASYQTIANKLGFDKPINKID